MPVTSFFLQRIILFAAGRRRALLMPKVLINAQKEQICRSRKPPSLEITAIVGVPKRRDQVNYNFGLNAQGRKCWRFKGGRR
jgi:hypothetical protein